MPYCGFAEGVGADQAEYPVGMLRERGPGLVAVDDVMVAVAHRLGAEGSEVGAGAGLGIALAPPVLARENPRQKLLLLRLIAERIDDGTDHGDAERQRRHRAGARGLLFEDETLVIDQPGPPYSFGQSGAIQPFLWRIRCHSSICALVRSVSGLGTRISCG